MIALPNLKVETKGLRHFTEGLRQWLEVAPVGLNQGIRNAAGLLTDRLLKFTPPISPRGNPLRLGEKAVKRDIHRAVQPLDWRKWSNPKIRRMIRNGDIKGLNAFFANLKAASPGRRDVKVVRFSPKLHQQARQSRGRVHRWTGLLTDDKEFLDLYVKRIQKHVGMAKGGWASAAKALRVPVPGWALRHAGQGKFRDTLDHGGGITIRNESAWADYDAQRICENALQSVSRQMFAAVRREDRRAHLLR